MNIALNGYVVADDDKWLYDWFEIGCFSPSVVRNVLAELPAGEELTLEINSCGGSVFAGFEIYSLLRSARQPTTAVVQSVAASAASTLMLGCDKVLLSPVAQVMIHLPLTSTEGNREDHLESVRVLDSLTESILNAYQLRCGGKATREQLEQLLEESTWLPAQDAVELGLADGIMLQETEEAQLPLSVVNAVGSGIQALASNSAGLPDAAELRQRYHQMVANGAKPAQGHEPQEPENGPDTPCDDWQREARLAIEYNRYL